MANWKRKGTARRHRSLMYCGVYGGNGDHRKGKLAVIEDRVAAGAVTEALEDREVR